MAIRMVLNSCIPKSRVCACVHWMRWYKSAEHYFQNRMQIFTFDFQPELLKNQHRIHLAYRYLKLFSMNVRSLFLCVCVFFYYFHLLFIVIMKCAEQHITVTVVQNYTHIHIHRNQSWCLRESRDDWWYLAPFWKPSTLATNSNNEAIKRQRTHFVVVLLSIVLSVALMHTHMDR